MQDYKLIKLIQVLSSKELAEMERNLATPLFNTNVEVSKLFHQLCKYHPKFDQPKLTKERLFAKLYGKAPYNDGKMRKLMTQLTQLIEQFLIAKELDASEDVKAKLLARSLAGRQNYNLFLDVVDARLKELDKGVQRGKDYFREGYELSEMLYYHPGSGKTDKRVEYYERAISDLEIYFTLEMLQFEANNIVRNRLVRQKGSRIYLDAVLGSSKFDNFAGAHSVTLFHHIVKLLKGEVDENLEQLSMTTFNAFNLLSRFEQELAISLLRNYAVPMSNKGSLPHKKFVLDLYKMELNSDFKTIYISASAFMNIATIGLSLGELEWVQEFIGEFSKLLSDKDKDVALNFCQGAWHYSMGLRNDSLSDFYDGLYHFTKISARAEPINEIRVRTYLLRINFEIYERKKESIENILNIIRNFERYLNSNNEVAESIRNSYLVSLRYAKHLARVVDNPQSNESNILQLREKLLVDDSDIALKSWLIEKVNGLINTE